MSLYVLILFTAFCGFLLAMYIFHKKRSGESMVCPLNMDCKPVIRSKYSKFLGVPVELMGMLYYASIAITYGLILGVPGLGDGVFKLIVLIATFGAFLFSLYLTAVQAFALREWCSWCLLSAFLSTLIFLISLAAFDLDTVANVLIRYDMLLSLFITVGIALGVGSATIGDVLFLKFLKDLRISFIEQDILHSIAQIAWGGQAMIVLGLLGSFVVYSHQATIPSAFFLISGLLAILILNTIALNLYIMPNLVRISFGKKHKHMPGELHRMRRSAYALGAISLVSWYFILSVHTLDIGNILSSFLIYVFAILVGLALSQFIEATFGSKIIQE